MTKNDKYNKKIRGGGKASRADGVGGSNENLSTIIKSKIWLSLKSRKLQKAISEQIF